MGRRARVNHYVGDILATLADSHKDVIDVRNELDILATARNDQWFFNSMVDFVCCIVSLIAVYIFSTLIATVGRCVLELDASDSSVSLAINNCVLDQVGFVVLMVCLSVVTLQFKSIIQRYQSSRMASITRRESQLRHRIAVVFLKLACKVYDISVPTNLSADVYISTVVDVLANATAIMAPLVALFWPNWLRFFRFTSAVGFLSKAWSRISANIKNAWYYCISREYSSYQKISALAAAVGLISGASWYGTRKYHNKTSHGSLRVVPKRKQRVYTENPPVRPVDPSELNFVYNTPEFVTPNRTFPEHPTFNGVSVAEKSLVRINGKYSATAFRVGNNLVTAMHCVGRDESFPGDGIACYNPEDNKFYWAPLEKCFRNKSPMVGGDGVAICSLPNHDFFLTRHSCQITVPNKKVAHAGSYRLQNFEGKPNFTFSIGPCDVEQYLLAFKSSVEPGSSGGPIINPDGSVIAVVVGHTQFSNYGLLITDEIRDFLVKGGDAEPTTSETHTQSQSDINSISTESSEESSTEEDETPKPTGSGLVQTPKEKSKPSKASPGIMSSGDAWRMRRKKKPAGVGPPSPGDHIESKQETAPQTSRT